MQSIALLVDDPHSLVAKRQAKGIALIERYPISPFAFNRLFMFLLKKYTN